MNVKQKRKQNGRRVKPAHSTDWKMKRQQYLRSGPEMLHQWRGQLFCLEDHEGGFDMSGSNSAERKRHEPLVLVETADLSEEDWLDYRRRGIGGSDRIGDLWHFSIPDRQGSVLRQTEHSVSGR